MRSKILNQDTLPAKLAKWRFLGQRISFTNGCFDLLHVGHLKTIRLAAEKGDLLIIGLNSDASVKRLKGKDRPKNKEQDRALLLAALQYVDAVVLFEEDTPQQLIELIQPDVLVKGGDYTLDQIVGADIVQAKGGEVHIVPLIKGISTTILLGDKQT